MTAQLGPRPVPRVAHVALCGVSRELKLAPNAAECTFVDLPLDTGPGRLEAWVESNGPRAGVLGISVERGSDDR